MTEAILYLFNMLCTARRIAAHQLRGRIAQPTTSPVAFFSPAVLRRLASTLAVLEQKEGRLNHGSLSAITAAQKVGGPVHGFVAGSNIKPVADEAATADGVEKIIAVDNGAYDKVYTHAGLDSGIQPREALQGPVLDCLPTQRQNADQSSL